MKPTSFQKEILDSVHSIITSAYHCSEFENFSITKETELVFPVLLANKDKMAISKHLNGIIMTIKGESQNNSHPELLETNRNLSVNTIS